MNGAILKRRLQETPCMEPADAVKLLYQSEFGCGHLPKEEGALTRGIERDIQETDAEVNALPFLDLGDGLCRLNLRAASVRGLPPERLARMVEESAKETQGSLERFLQKLEWLRGLCREETLPFEPEALDSYLADYAREGYPLVRHSPLYRASYAPAYRVVSRVYALALPVLSAVQGRLDGGGRALVIIDGDCASGKTALAKAIAALFAGTILPMDDFFLPPGMRSEERLGAPGGNIHFERFRGEVLEGLLAGGRAWQPFTYDRYDCQSGRVIPRRVDPENLVIVEGSYSLHPAFAGAYEALGGMRVFLSIGQEEQLRRLGRRNPALLSRFRQEWIPLEKAYAKAYDVQGKADFSFCTDSYWEDANGEDEP